MTFGELKETTRFKDFVKQWDDYFFTEVNGLKAHCILGDHIDFVRYADKKNWIVNVNLAEITADQLYVLWRLLDFMNVSDVVFTVEDLDDV